MSYVSLSYLAQISKSNNKKYDQKFISIRDKIKHLIDLLPIDEMTRVPDDDVRFAERRAIARLRTVACADPRCKITQAGVLHFHCPNCSAPYKLQFSKWNDVVNAPRYCQWCHAQMTYPRDAVKAVKVASQAINDYNAKRKTRQKTLDELNNDAFNDGMTNGYWKDGVLYSPNYGTAYYDPLQPDSDNYKY